MKERDEGKELKTKERRKGKRERRCSGNGRMYDGKGGRERNGKYGGLIWIWVLSVDSQSIILSSTPLNEMIFTLIWQINPAQDDPSATNEIQPFSVFTNHKQSEMEKGVACSWTGQSYSLTRKGGGAYVPI